MLFTDILFHACNGCHFLSWPRHTDRLLSVSGRYRGFSAEGHSGRRHWNFSFLQTSATEVVILSGDKVKKESFISPAPLSCAAVIIKYNFWTFKTVATALSLPLALDQSLAHHELWPSQSESPVLLTARRLNCSGRAWEECGRCEHHVTKT